MSPHDCRVQVQEEKKKEEKEKEEEKEEEEEGGAGIGPALAAPRLLSPGCCPPAAADGT